MKNTDPVMDPELEAQLRASAEAVGDCCGGRWALHLVDVARELHCTLNSPTVMTDYGELGCKQLLRAARTVAKSTAHLRDALEQRKVILERERDALRAEQPLAGLGEALDAAGVEARPDGSLTATKLSEEGAPP